MVEVKGGRGKYIEVFFIFGCGEYIYFLALGMFVGATLLQILVVDVYMIDRKGKEGSVTGA